MDQCMSETKKKFYHLNKLKDFTNWDIISMTFLWSTTYFNRECSWFTVVLPGLTGIVLPGDVNLPLWVWCQFPRIQNNTGDYFASVTADLYTLIIMHKLKAIWTFLTHSVREFAVINSNCRIKKIIHAVSVPQWTFGVCWFCVCCVRWVSNVIVSIKYHPVLSNMLLGYLNCCCLWLTNSPTEPCVWPVNADLRLLAFGVWLMTLFNPLICYCSGVTGALKVFSERRLVRPLYCTIALTMRTAYAIYRQHIFSHTFNGLPIFVLCLVCPASPTPPSLLYTPYPPYPIQQHTQCCKFSLYPLPPS